MCGCKPGTEENGWHEIRCHACNQKERDLFTRAIKVAHKLTRKANRNGR